MMAAAVVVEAAAAEAAIVVTAAATDLAVLPAAVAAPAIEPVPVEPAPRLAPFNPTDDAALGLALDLAALTDDDVLVDAGAGDGRVLVAAARRTGGLRAVGIEYDAALAARRC